MRKISIIACLLILLVGSGCDNTVEPVVEDSSVRYVIYGFLDMRSETQVIRVEVLRPTILAEGDELDGVEVTVSDEETGQRYVMTDSVGTAQDGSAVALYVARFLPEPGHRYRLEVARPGEVGTVATTQIPPEPVFFRDAPVGGLSDMTLTVRFGGINGRPGHFVMHYTVAAPNGEDTTHVQVNYGDIVQGPVQDLSFPVEYFADRFIVMNSLGLDVTDVGVRLRRLELSFDIPSAEWYLLESTNIVRGHGFFAAIGRYSVSWRLDSSKVFELGWIDEQ